MHDSSDVLMEIAKRLNIRCWNATQHPTHASFGISGGITGEKIKKFMEYFDKPLEDFSVVNGNTIIIKGKLVPR